MKHRLIGIWLLSLFCLPLLADQYYNTDANLYGDWQNAFYSRYQNGEFNTYSNPEWPINGTGEQDNPYQIDTEWHLACLAYWVNVKHNTFEGKYFVLRSNLNLGYRRWMPIGVDKEHPFRGYFRGVEHTISEMNISVVNGDDSKSYYYGLFGYCEAIIWDLEVKDASININQDNHEFSTRWLCSGLLCGALSYYRGSNLTIYGAIYNCKASGNISGDIGDTGTRSCLGGLVGYADNPVSIYHCHTNLTSTLKGAFDMGGIVGQIHGYDYNYLYYWKFLTDNNIPVPLETFVYDCTADVNLTVTKDEIDYYHVGGICGTSEGNIEACASSGYVTAGTDGTAAGICGRNMGNVIACVSMVTATGGYNVGGIVGKNESRTINGKTFNAQIHDCVFSGHLDGTNSMYCGGLAARSSGDHVINSLFLGTIQASTSSKYTSPLQQRTDGGTDYPDNCHYDKNLFLFQSDYLDYEKDDIAMTNYYLTGASYIDFNSNDKLTSMKNVYYNQPAADVTAIQWIYADGFYPRLSISNSSSGNAENGILRDDVIRRALTVTAQDLYIFRTNLLPNYAWLTSVPACLTSGQYAYQVDNAITMTSKSGNNHTASYSLPTGQTVLAISETTATPAESGNVMLTIHDAATSLSKRLLLTVVQGKRQWDGILFVSFDGEGTEPNPYLIHNAGQFARMITNNEANNYYKLTQDIWFNDDLLSDTGTPKEGKYKWNRNSATDAYDWKGHLNGDGHVVHGMYLDNSYGIFTDLEGDASIENIAFVNSYVSTTAPTSGSESAALLARELSADAVVRNCLIDGAICRNAWTHLDVGGVFARLRTNSNSQYATIEDCVVSVTGIYAATDVAEKYPIDHAFTSINSSSLGRIRRVLMLNNSEPYHGMGYPSNSEVYEPCQCYYPMGYFAQREGGSFTGALSVAAMTNGTLFANQERWTSVEGRFPMLKSFANTDYGKLLAMPIYTTEKNTLQTLELITDFERGAATWKMVDPTVIDLVSDLEVMEPLRADRTHLVRTLGEAKIITPITVISGFTPGINFVDEYAENFCVASFDGNNDNKVNLSEVVAVASSDFVSAMSTQATYTNAIKKFPELRYFMAVDDLQKAFQDKSSLQEVTLPAKIRSLDNDLFSGCSSLTSFTIPVSITSLGTTHPFNGSAIRNFSTEKSHPTMTTRDGVLMTKEGNQLVCYPNGRTNADITLSGTVERINSNAIYKVDGATNIYLDAPDYNCFTDLAEDGITSYNGELMTIYVKDATNELTDNERSEAMTGIGKGYLLEQFKAASCWSAYAQEGKLKRYFELEVNTNSWDATHNCYWATMYIGFDTQLPDELTPYIVDKERTNTSSETLVLRKISNKVPMLTPVIIKASAAGNYKLYPSEENKLPDLPMYENMLNGTGRDGLAVNQSSAIDGGCLTLGRNKNGRVGFFIYKGTKKIPAYRAYLTVNKVQSRRLLDIADDGPTAISPATTRQHATDEVIYDLQGRKVTGASRTSTSRLKTGLYIQNGKKVVVK